MTERVLIRYCIGDVVMYIRSLSIKNFRGLESVLITMKDSMLAIAGQNDAGKSTILRAIRIFLEDEKISGDDFSRRTPDLPIEIEIYFETREFPDFKHENLLKIRQIYSPDEKGRIVTMKNGFFKIALQNTDELDDYKTLKSMCDVFNIEMPAKKAIGDALRELKQLVIEKMEAADAAWYDISSEWSNIKKAFPEVLFIPASQDHGNEQKMTSDTSSFGKLFRVGVRKWLQYDPKSKEAIVLLESKVAEINGKILETVEARLKEQVQIAESLNQRLDPLDVSKGFSFTMDVKDFHGITTPLSQRGSGLQRAVLIAAIRAQTDINKYISEMAATATDSLQEENDNGLLYLIEEPEAFLHLAAQKDLFYSLKDLSKSGQILLTTHSTLFIDENEMQDIVLLKRVDGKTISLQHVPQEDIRDELGENIRISEIITGKVCCIVEGVSDKHAFQEWLKILGFDSRQNGIHFISMDGCTNAGYYANSNILFDFNVPFIMVLDTDTHQTRDANTIKKYLEGKDPFLRSNNRIRVLSGEIENYFNLSDVSQVLKIPVQYINSGLYSKDPKKALEEAKNKAIDDELPSVRAYHETRDARKMAMLMTKEDIMAKSDICDILFDLIRLAGGNPPVIKEIEVR